MIIGVLVIVVGLIISFYNTRSINRSILLLKGKTKEVASGKFSKISDIASPPEIKELVSAARKFGKQVFAHASGADGIDNAVAGGVDSVEHGYFIRRDQLAKLRDRHRPADHDLVHNSVPPQPPS